MAQTKQTKHTPTPWKYHLGRGSKPRFHIQTEGGYQIAITTELTTRLTAKLASDFDENEAREANAALIVRAVNSHEKLLGALQTLLAIIHQQGPIVDSKFDNGIVQAQRALAHATGE